MAARRQQEVQAMFTHPVTAHSWNADGSLVAIIPNSNHIKVYDYGKKEVIADVVEHDQKALSVHWAPESNRLVTCGEDRAAYVWERKDGTFVPKLAHLGTGVNRAALCCRWNPSETKFAVGTGAMQLCVCYFDSEQDWWVSKTALVHDSSITCLAWNPTGNGVVATGSTDCTCRLVSGFIRGVDTGTRVGKFGQVLQNFQSGAWIRAIAWSADGSLLAWTSHDSSVSVADVNADYATQVVKTRVLPFTDLAVVGNNTIILAGSDCFLYVLSKADDQWALTGRLKGQTTEAKAASGVSAARARFQLEATTGQTKAVGKLESKHQNIISSVEIVTPGDSGWKVSSASLDGNIFLWTEADVAPMD